jgi:hypothetical protein
MRSLIFAATLALLSSSAVAHADGVQTDLSVSGTQSVELTASDANACYMDSDSTTFNAQLTDQSSDLIISINVLGTVGDHPARAADGHPQLTILGTNATGSDLFVNWSATGGSVSLDDLDTQVALDDGSASTHGALGHVDADLSSSQGMIHLSGPFACHLAG